MGAGFQHDPHGIIRDKMTESIAVRVNPGCHPLHPAQC